MKYDIVDVINQIIKDGIRNQSSSHFSESYSETSLEVNGHFIVSLKFFKFVTDNDTSKEQREVEIIRTVSFIDIEGFNKSFTNILVNNQQVSLKQDPRNYTLSALKNLFESIASFDLEKYSEINSVVASSIIDILRMQNSSLFVFGFVDQDQASIYESTVTLEILNKVKLFNIDYFFSLVQEMNINLSETDNKYLKEEFHIVEIIFSELLFCLERSNFKFGDDFYNEIKEMDQVGKYNHLRSLLETKAYDFERNPQLNSIFSNVFSYFQSRAKWKCIYKARDDIIKLSQSYKEETEEEVNQTIKNKGCKTGRLSSANESADLRVRVKI